jgi:hypothetical protein
MGSSEPAARRAPAWRWAAYAGLALLIFVAGLGAGWWLRGAVPVPAALPARVVKYRYRFGGEVVTHYLPSVVAATVYRGRAGVDEVVFNLEDGHDYVLNADKLVDYQLPADGSVERREVRNELYYHYDPYLQAEKQQAHREWTNEQFLQWVGRLPTEQEWLEVLNELTRGVDHRQMERWIQYAPDACRRFVRQSALALWGREPNPAELEYYYRQLIDGDSYENVRKAIAGRAIHKE